MGFAVRSRWIRAASARWHRPARQRGRGRPSSRRRRMPRVVRLRLIGCPNTAVAAHQWPVNNCPRPLGSLNALPRRARSGAEARSVHRRKTQARQRSRFGWRTPASGFMTRRPRIAFAPLAVAQVQAQRGDCDGSTRMIHSSHLARRNPSGHGTDLMTSASCRTAGLAAATMMPRSRNRRPRMDSRHRA